MIIRQFLHKQKYEILLIALLQHLFVGIFLRNLPFYITVVWPINMLVLGVASVGVFIEKGTLKNRIKNVLVVLVIVIPLEIPFIGMSTTYFLFLNVIYVLFFGFIFLEVIKFLIKPSYINVDIISACACGYLLLIEISTFLFQSFFYIDSNCFKGLDISSPAAIYIDLVYFSTIILTSIGLGDILPNIYYTKLVTAFFGIVGQFYSVVLVGIIISKFTSKSDH